MMMKWHMSLLPCEFYYVPNKIYTLSGARFYDQFSYKMLVFAKRPAPILLLIVENSPDCLKHASFPSVRRAIKS